MIACFDVHYFEKCVSAAAVVFDNWTDLIPVEQRVVYCEPSHSYVAGEFYKRELRPLKQVIASLDHQIQTYVIDAYCHLSNDLEAGLGQHLFNSLASEAVVIGVAKNRFCDTKHAAEVLRGDSKRALFVTSIGLEYSLAAEYVKSMHGDHRIPTLLKLVDRLARDGENTN